MEGDSGGTAASSQDKGKQRMEIDVREQVPLHTGTSRSSSTSIARPTPRSAPAVVSEATRLADLADPAAALKRELARKKAEIVSGFPLAGLLSRATGVIGHLHALEGMPVSNFCYPAPEGDPGPRTLASDPLLRDYAREIQVLLGPASGPSADPTISQEDADRLRQSALDAFQSAARKARSNPKNMDGLWKSQPYAVPASIQRTSGPYVPTTAALEDMKRSYPAFAGSLASVALDSVHLPYPSPRHPTSEANEKALTSLAAAYPVDPSESLTASQQREVKEERRFAQAFVDDILRKAATTSSDGQVVQSTPFGSSFASTPSAASQPPSAARTFSNTQRPSTSIFPSSSAPSFTASSAVASTSRTVTSPARQPSRANGTPEPTAAPQPPTSSPDPMALIMPAYRPKQSLSRPSSQSTPSISTSHIVVEVPITSKKRSDSSAPSGRPKSSDLLRRAISTDAARKVLSSTKVSHSKHGPFSEPSSDIEVPAFEYVEDDDEEDCKEEDEQEEGVMVVAPSRSPPKKKLKLAPTSQPTPSATPSPTVSPRKQSLPSGKAETEQLQDKLVRLLESIHAAADALSHANGMDQDESGDEEEEERHRKHFILPSESASSSGELLLQPKTMSKLAKAVQALVKAPGGKKAMETHIGEALLSRTLKILGRSVSEAEQLRAVPDRTSSAAKKPSGKENKSPTKVTPKKGGKAKKDAKGRERSAESSGVKAVVARSERARRSATPTSSYDERDEDEKEERETDAETEDDYSQQSSQARSANGSSKTKGAKGKSTKGKGGKQAKEQESEVEQSWTAQSLRKLENNLTILHNGFLAVDTCFVILTSARLPKQLYSEDLITSCLNTLKIQLAGFVYLCLDPDRSPLPPAVLDGNTSALQDVLQLASAIIPKIANLAKQEEMSDSIVINAVYVAVAPFFADQAPPPGGRAKAKEERFGLAEMKAIRNQALGLVRTIFARYPEQRQWILEEILSSISKLPDIAKRKPQYLLQNGQAIQTVSVLLLHLVQSCTSGLRAKMLDVSERRRQEGSGKKGENDDIADLKDAEAIVEPALDASFRCGRLIISFLIGRAGKAPKNSTASEVEYKAVLDHLIKDLLLVLDLPEWPIAAGMLRIAIKSMSAVLEESKVSADVNTLKGICLELLGCIGARVHQLMPPAGRANGETEEQRNLTPIIEAMRTQDRKSIKYLAKAEENLIQQLLTGSSEDGAIETAADFVAARWSIDLLQAIRFLPNVQDEADIKPKFEAELHKRHTALWELQPSLTTFHSTSSEGRAVLAEATKALFPVHGLPVMMEALIERILESCDGSVIAFRQKALKALGAIVEQDSSIFFQPNVRLAVEKRLMDSSPAVRDAALDMLGRYVVYNPELAVQYLPNIAERITDSGLSVRKRVIKLLKSLYPVITDHALRVDICRRLVCRINDEDDNVKELAAAAVEELWFTNTKAPSVRGGSCTDREISPDKKREMSNKSHVLMAVAGSFRERPSPLEEIVKLIIEKHTSAKTPKTKDGLTNFTAALREIVEALVEALIAAEEDAAFDIVNCIKTIYILLLADASMLSLNRASLLLPYLRGASTPEEHVMTEHLLKIFTAVLPHMPPSASKFATDLQESSMVMLNQPGKLGPQALQELIACFVSVIVHQTYDYAKLCNTFKICHDRLRKGVAALQTGAKLSPEAKAQHLRSLPTLARMVALFCQYANFDRLREITPDAEPFVDNISQDCVRDDVYIQMVQIYRLSSGTNLHGIALQCLGFLYRAYPTLMTDEDSTAIMDRIFTSGTADARALLLRTICDFLTSQSVKQTEEEAAVEDGGDAVDMRQLVGNTENFADSGVSAAVIQRYLPHILTAASNPARPPAVMRPALDIIAFTVKQGLAHPMQCLPVLVSLETGTDTNVANRAYSLHSHLNTKHSTLINSRIGESIQAAFRYQVRAQAAEAVRGSRGDPPVALLSRWYSLMREKRQGRLDFLKAFVRGLQIEATPVPQCDRTTVEFARFTAENLATFEYKTLEEALYVIKVATVLLSTTGMHVYHQLQDRDASMDVDAEEGTAMEPGSASLAATASLANKSIVLGYAFCLRNHLKTLYNITEQKMAKYVIGKKSSAGDKPAVVKSGADTALSSSELPFALKPMLDESDYNEQRDSFIRLMDSDDTLRESAEHEEMSE